MEIDLHNFFKFYDEKNPNHVKAVGQLVKELEIKAPEQLTNQSAWVLTFRTATENPTPKKTVPFYPQTDNFTQPESTCNSSSCAMCLEYYLPGSLPSGPRGDDTYLKKVLAVGNSTDHNAQSRVLKAYGLDSAFVTNLSFKQLDEHLEKTGPIVAGILHRGSNSNPTRNGGHMIVIHGKLPNGNYICNDPYGDLNSGYVTAVEKGKNVVYERWILEKRWTVDGPGTGWGRVFFPKKG